MNDLSLHLLDIVQNSITAGASLITILLDEQPLSNTLTLSVSDNGRGMTAEQVAKVTDPYFTSRTTRKVGLGIPLFKQSAETSGGQLVITSSIGEGTTTTAVFGYNHIDRLPIGNMPNAIMLLVSSNPAIDFIYTCRYNNEEYIFDTKEVKETLEGTPLNHPTIIKYLEEMIEENTQALKV